MGGDAEGSLSDFVVSGAAVQLEGGVPLRCNSALLEYSESAISGTVLLPGERHCSKVALQVVVSGCCRWLLVVVGGRLLVVVSDC